MKIQELIPTANVPGRFANNSYFEPLNISDPYMYLITGDYAISATDRLNASFMRRKQVVTPDARSTLLSRSIRTSAIPAGCRVRSRICGL
ncbi:MAG TPA: hypothetical protein VER03_08845 [Bryobacteraceae bacterium]|nr:hypothetical protein [Bryobacteraceae bacterium]